ncbi:MAG: 16S rRNA (uracil(1498)-N(3))-methyltransferase [Armatimonadota bacterium]
MWLIINSEEHRGEDLEICGPRFHHLARVCRVRVGETLRAALPDGRVVRAAVSEITMDAVRARIVAEESPADLPPCRITLYQAVLKGEKMDFVVQKATELGACTLVPLQARRSVPRWTPDQALERAGRWQRIADAAAEQCERSIPLQVEPPQCLTAAIAAQPSLTLLLHERDGQNLHDLATSHPRVTDLGLYLGPEGGWDDEEVQILRAAGVLPVHLGPRILRAETAAVTTLALAQYLWGDIG